MNQQQDEQLKELLRGALPPMSGEQPSRDLWPEMLRRLDRGSRVSWWDVAIGFGTLAGFCAWPQVIPWALIHF